MLGPPAITTPELLTTVSPVLTLPLAVRSISLFSSMLKVPTLPRPEPVDVATTPILPGVKSAGTVAPPVTLSVVIIVLAEPISPT